MVDDRALKLEQRTAFGKKARTLRRGGITPANVYGRGLESVAVQAPLIEFRRIFRQVERNAIVDVHIEGEERPRAVVLRSVSRHPLTNEVQHIDLYQVDLARPIHASVELVLNGKAPAVDQGGTLIQSLGTVLVEALPRAMPSHIDVNLDSLDNFGDAVHVGDLPLPNDVTFVTDLQSTVVSVAAPRLLEEEEEKAAADAEAALAEGEEAPEAADGQALPAAGERPSEGAASKAE